MSKQKKADLTILIITFFWGVANVVSDYAMEEVTPIQISAFRFGGAFLLCLIFLPKMMKGVNKETLKASFVLGLMLALVYILAMYGILYTNMTNFSFLIGLPVVITPLINFVFRKIKPGKKLFVCLVMTVIGMGLMTLTPGAGFSMALGDIMAIASAVCYAVNIVYTEVLVKRPEINPEQLGIFQIGFGALILVALMLCTDPVVSVHRTGTWAALFFLAAFATFFAFFEQPRVQQYTVSTHLGIIFALEPVFSAGCDFPVHHTVVPLRSYTGAALMLAAVLIMNLDKSVDEAK